MKNFFRDARFMSVAFLLAGNAAFAAGAGVEVAPAAKDKCQVSCIDPYPCCEESHKVLEVLQKLLSAYSKGDVNSYEHFLDDHCTMFDDQSKELLSGKAEVIKHLGAEFAANAVNGPTPLLSLSIDQPYAKVTGDTCVVTFVATEKVGGAHPLTRKANVTDVFVKRDGEWKKVHFRGHWEVVASK